MLSYPVAGGKQVTDYICQSYHRQLWFLATTTYLGFNFLICSVRVTAVATAETVAQLCQNGPTIAKSSYFPFPTFL